MKERVIFDLDNCISDDGWRIDTIDWSRSVEEGRYDKYHAACQADALANFEVIARHLALGRELIFLTARPIGCYVATCEWLAQNLDLDDMSTYTLLMREEGDHRASAALKEDMLSTLEHWNIPLSSIVAAYDDRPDVVDMYRRKGLVGAEVLACHALDAFTPPPQSTRMEITMIEPAQPTAADILAEAAETFRQRNAVYGSNYEMVGPIMKILFPKGVDAELLGNDAFHLFELLVVKMSRLAVSKLTHQDSARDASVYAAMIEMCIKNGEQA